MNFLSPWNCTGSMLTCASRLVQVLPRRHGSVWSLVTVPAWRHRAPKFPQVLHHPMSPFWGLYWPLLRMEAWVSARPGNKSWNSRDVKNLARGTYHLSSHIPPEQIHFIWWPLFLRQKWCKLKLSGSYIHAWRCWCGGAVLGSRSN